MRRVALAAPAPRAPAPGARCRRRARRGGSCASTLEHRQVLGVVAHAGQRHLVRAEGPLDRHAVDDLRARSSPSACAARSPASAGARRRRARAPRPGWRGSSRRQWSSACRERLVHGIGGRRRPRRSARRSRAPPAACARPRRRSRPSTVGPGDLVAVEVQDRQHRAVARRVQEADALPRALERTGLRLAVADDRDGDQIRVVEHGAEGVREHVAELAALVDRSRRRDADVAGDAARRRELAEEPAQAGGVRRHVRDRSREYVPSR